MKKIIVGFIVVLAIFISHSAFAEETVQKVHLTAPIIWVETEGKPEKCGVATASGCYVPAENVIYMKRNIDPKDNNKDFVLYHEIGHSLFKENYPVGLFQGTPSLPHYEIMANDFAFWIYSFKKPTEYVPFIKEIMTPEQIKYFSDRCDQSCIDEILSVRILPNIPSFTLPPIEKVKIPAEVKQTPTSVVETQIPATVQIAELPQPKQNIFRRFINWIANLFK